MLTNILFTMFAIVIIQAQLDLDNSIIGNPKIDCKPDSITFSFNTKNPFRGNVYIRGFYDKPSCRKRYEVMSAQGGYLSIRLNDCGMTRMRQMMPRGVSLHVTFVANFHPLFTTKEDRAFDVRCFYAHPDSQVNTGIEVGNLPAETLEQATTATPRCEYSLRETIFDGPRAGSTSVGRPIVHRWDCDTNGNFGILVKSCTISNSRSSVPFIDEHGCPISQDFPQVVYLPSLTSAYVIMEAISFPDHATVAFSCQIAICDKTTDECLGISPPRCNNLPNVQSSIIIDNNLPLDIDGIGIEPWMKEPSPIDDNNDTLIVFSSTTELPTPMPRLTELPPHEDMIEVNHVHREARQIRLARNVIDVMSPELFVSPIRDTSEKKAPESNCISGEVELLHVGLLHLDLTVVPIEAAVVVEVEVEVVEEEEDRCEDGEMLKNWNF
ncbi:unnamed protein product [Caenorhabditis bovis]|uniref:ZP domain-containing protein n=1 Tax=Caenorhabditis bovis TaxID=2654633 RepID=A0A8S1F3L3_9PELO|nr:unnamed protein product [Caenorhabditis bovis]